MACEPSNALKTKSCRKVNVCWAAGSNEQAVVLETPLINNFNEVVKIINVKA